MSEIGEFHIDLTEAFPHLDHAPIVEAVIDLRARAESPWEESAISQQLKPKLADYPTVTSEKEIRQGFRIEPGAPPQAVIQDSKWKGLRFQSADQRYIAQFNRDGFVLSRLQPYENWEKLYREAMRLWKFYVEVACPSEAQRIGLRFINRIELSLHELRTYDFIQPTPRAPEGLTLPFSAFFHRDTFMVPGRPYAINLVRTIQPGPSPTENVALILDIDVFTLQSVDLQETTLTQNLMRMRWLKNKIFFGSITRKALERFQ